VSQAVPADWSPENAARGAPAQPRRRAPRARAPRGAPCPGAWTAARRPRRQGAAASGRPPRPRRRTARPLPAPARGGGAARARPPAARWPPWPAAAAPPSSAHIAPGLRPGSPSRQNKSCAAAMLRRNATRHCHWSPWPAAAASLGSASSAPSVREHWQLRLEVAMQATERGGEQHFRKCTRCNVAQHCSRDLCATRRGGCMLWLAEVAANLL